MSPEKDDAYNAFVLSLKPKKERRYHLPTGSLTDFIVSDSHLPSYKCSDTTENAEDKISQKNAASYSNRKNSTARHYPKKRYSSMPKVIFSSDEDSTDEENVGKFQISKLCVADSSFHKLDDINQTKSSSPFSQTAKVPLKEDLYQTNLITQPKFSLADEDLSLKFHVKLETSDEEEECHDDSFHNGSVIKAVPDIGGPVFKISQNLCDSLLPCKYSLTSDTEHCDEKIQSIYSKFRISADDKVRDMRLSCLNMSPSGISKQTGTETSKMMVLPSEVTVSDSSLTEENTLPISKPKKLWSSAKRNLLVCLDLSSDDGPNLDDRVFASPKARIKHRNNDFTSPSTAATFDHSRSTSLESCNKTMSSAEPTECQSRKDGLPTCLPKNCDKGLKFRRNRSVLTKAIYDNFNKTIFQNQLPMNMIVEWSNRLTRTAGVTKCSTQWTSTIECGIVKRECHYTAKISLSEKVLDDVYRLRDTLCHEMCHAAVWMIEHENESHGPFWKAWARKAMSFYPEMPAMKRCHSYDISYKYQYQCQQCRKVYGRHSKSIKVDKQVCGLCKGNLALLSDGKTTKTPNKFALFVKENYNSTQKSQSLGGNTPKHSEVMKALSLKFATLSAGK